MKIDICNFENYDTNYSWKVETIYYRSLKDLKNIRSIKQIVGWHLYTDEFLNHLKYWRFKAQLQFSK